jgi:iron(III) transport system permease protein
VLGAGVLLLCALALAPVLSLGWFAFAAGEGSRFDLGYGGAEQVLNTLALVALVGLLTALLGTEIGCVSCRL